jgi:hypothetical protein
VLIVLVNLLIFLDFFITSRLQPFADQSAFVLWMRAGVDRCRREPAQALSLYTRAAELATELPPLVEMVRYDQLWAALLACDFAAAAAAVDALFAVDARSPLYHVLRLLVLGRTGDEAGVTRTLAALDALRVETPALFKPKSTGQ